MGRGEYPFDGRNWNKIPLSSPRPGKSRLWKWLIGQEEPPNDVEINPVFIAVREKIAKNLHTHAAPETRATPGQPWVRGWDDFKKGKDSPITGNQ